MSITNKVPNTRVMNGHLYIVTFSKWLKISKFNPNYFRQN